MTSPKATLQSFHLGIYEPFKDETKTLLTNRFDGSKLAYQAGVGIAAVALHWPQGVSWRNCIESRDVDKTRRRLMWDGVGANGDRRIWKGTFFPFSFSLSLSFFFYTFCAIFLGFNFGYEQEFGRGCFYWSLLPLNLSIDKVLSYTHVYHLYIIFTLYLTISISDFLVIFFFLFLVYSFLSVYYISLSPFSWTAHFDPLFTLESIPIHILRFNGISK